MPSLRQARDIKFDLHKKRDRSFVLFVFIIIAVTLAVTILAIRYRR